MGFQQYKDEKFSDFYAYMVDFCWPGVTYMVSLPADQASKHPGHESMVKSIDQFACLQK